MRRLLGLLRESDDELARAPLPSLGAHRRPRGSAARRRPAGRASTSRATPVELPPGVDLSAYRIVQEALTNALKHAGPAHARVRIRYGADAVELEIARRRPRPPGAATGTGNGLVGMRERVGVFGGALDAGPRAEGGFAVRAALPSTAQR